MIIIYLQIIFSTVCQRLRVGTLNPGEILCKPPGKEEQKSRRF